MSVQSVLREAVVEDPPRVVRIEYEKKSTGETKTYYIEPYETRGSQLWGWDRVDGHIKQFVLGNVIIAELTDEEFSPRFPLLI